MIEEILKEYDFKLLKHDKEYRNKDYNEIKYYTNVIHKGSLKFEFVYYPKDSYYSILISNDIKYESFRVSQDEFIDTFKSLNDIKSLLGKSNEK